MVEAGEAQPGSELAEVRTDNTLAAFERAMESEIIRLNKKGALEMILSDVIHDLNKTQSPSTWSQAVVKYESGKCILLSSELGLYLVQSMFISIIGKVYRSDEWYWHPNPMKNGCISAGATGTQQETTGIGKVLGLF